MKLLKHKSCLWELCGGNVKIQTTLVEGPGIGFWTRVRLPSDPLNLKEYYPLTIGGVRRWVKIEYGLDISDKENGI